MTRATAVACLLALLLGMRSTASTPAPPLGNTDCTAWNAGSIVVVTVVAGQSLFMKDCIVAGVNVTFQCASPSEVTLIRWSFSEGNLLVAGPTSLAPLDHVSFTIRDSHIASPHGFAAAYSPASMNAVDMTCVNTTVSASAPLLAYAFAAGLTNAAMTVTDVSFRATNCSISAVTTGGNLFSAAAAALGLWARASASLQVQNLVISAINTSSISATSNGVATAASVALSEAGSNIANVDIECRDSSVQAGSTGANNLAVNVAALGVASIAGSRSDINGVVVGAARCSIAGVASPDVAASGAGGQSSMAIRVVAGGVLAGQNTAYITNATLTLTQCNVTAHIDARVFESYVGGGTALVVAAGVAAEVAGTFVQLRVALVSSSISALVDSATPGTSVAVSAGVFGSPIVTVTSVTLTSCASAAAAGELALAAALSVASMNYMGPLTTVNITAVQTTVLARSNATHQSGTTGAAALSIAAINDPPQGDVNRKWTDVTLVASQQSVISAWTHCESSSLSTVTAVTASVFAFGALLGNITIAITDVTLNSSVSVFSASGFSPGGANIVVVALSVGNCGNAVTLPLGNVTIVSRTSAIVAFTNMIAASLPVMRSSILVGAVTQLQYTTAVMSYITVALSSTSVTVACTCSTPAATLTSLVLIGATGSDLYSTPAINSSSFIIVDSSTVDVVLFPVATRQNAYVAVGGVSFGAALTTADTHFAVIDSLVTVTVGIGSPAVSLIMAAVAGAASFAPGTALLRTNFSAVNCSSLRVATSAVPGVSLPTLTDYRVAVAVAAVSLYQKSVSPAAAVLDTVALSISASAVLISLVPTPSTSSTALTILVCAGGVTASGGATTVTLSNFSTLFNASQLEAYANVTSGTLTPNTFMVLALSGAVAAARVTTRGAMVASTAATFRRACATQGVAMCNSVGNMSLDVGAGSCCNAASDNGAPPVVIIARDTWRSFVVSALSGVASFCVPSPPHYRSTLAPATTTTTTMIVGTTTGVTTGASITTSPGTTSETAAPSTNGPKATGTPAPSTVKPVRSKTAARLKHAIRSTSATLTSTRLRPPPPRRSSVTRSPRRPPQRNVTAAPLLASTRHLYGADVTITRGVVIAGYSSAVIASAVSPTEGRKVVVTARMVASIACPQLESGADSETFPTPDEYTLLPPLLDGTASGSEMTAYMLLSTILLILGMIMINVVIVVLVV